MLKQTFNNISDIEHNLIDDFLDFNTDLCYLLEAFKEFDFIWSISKEHNKYFISLEYRKNKKRSFDVLFRVVNENLKTAIEIWNKYINFYEMKTHFCLVLIGEKVQRIVKTGL